MHGSLVLVTLGAWIRGPRVFWGEKGSIVSNQMLWKGICLLSSQAGAITVLS